MSRLTERVGKKIALKRSDCTRRSEVFRAKWRSRRRLVMHKIGASRCHLISTGSQFDGFDFLQPVFSFLSFLLTISFVVKGSHFSERLSASLRCQSAAAHSVRQCFVFLRRFPPTAHQLKLDPDFTWSTRNGRLNLCQISSQRLHNKITSTKYARESVSARGFFSLESGPFLKLETVINGCMYLYKF